MIALPVIRGWIALQFVFCFAALFAVTIVGLCLEIGGNCCRIAADGLYDLTEIVANRGAALKRRLRS